MEITKLSQLDLSKTYTYADYLTWKFQERIELFKGKIHAMSPAPASRHQRISSKIGYEFQKFLEYKPCSVFYAPFDVRLEQTKNDKKVFTVVQPDISIICDESKIDERGCVGAPDVVVEILSPGNSTKEMKNKFDLYQEAGVLEYLIVQPADNTILQYQLLNGQYVNYRPLTIEDSLKSTVLTGFEVPLKKVFS
jgi:Uma2 family endonuclease